MENSLRRFTYHTNRDDDPPKVNEYMVSLTKKGPGTVYRVHSVRRVKSRAPVLEVKYAIECIPVPEMKPLTVHDEETHDVWVKGEPAHPMVWIPRSKKK